MDKPKIDSLPLDPQTAKMLRDLLTQASARGPDAETLARLYKGVVECCETLGIPT